MSRAATLVTARLRLRPATSQDGEAFHRLWTDPEVRRWLWDDAVIPRDRALAELERSTASFRRRGYGLWALLHVGAGQDASEGPLLGFCGLRETPRSDEAELLFGLAPEHAGRGLATEAARGVLDHAFANLGLARIRAGADPPHVASFRVMERLGMVFHERLCEQGRETVYYVVDRTAWERSGAEADPDRGQRRGGRT